MKDVNDDNLKKQREELAYGFYEEYTEEELEILPKIEPELLKLIIDKYGFNPLMWDGHSWGIAEEAFL